MRKALNLLLLCFLSAPVWAQKNGTVSGTAYDTISKQPVAAATITVLSAKDSSLVTFTMTGNDGRFQLGSLANGDYRLLITHVNYHNSNTWFTVSDSARSISLGNVVMNDKNKVLEEVVLAGEAPPVTLINDTIQYNAGSFKVQPNASVEQLLKKLPGVQVDKDGTIKAQGEKVSKVLVDGKEFFGNDPKIATKNLPADAVDKVQVYDKQSDQAALTGFDDGNYEKTINLKLKKDKKKGLFGKASAGAGNKERYEGKFNLNSFKGARQFSAIGMGNNTNAQGFSIMDILNFTGELARLQRGGGGNININISDEDAASMGINPGGRNSGITSSFGGGLNYNNIIGTKLDLQSNYFFNHLNPKTESFVRQSTPDGSYLYNDSSYTDNSSNSHRVNMNLLYQLDSSSTLRIVPSFSYQETDNLSNRNYNTWLGGNFPANEGYSRNRALNSGYTFSNEISWRKKFARKGRTFSLTLQTSLNDSKGSGSLLSVTDYYNPDGSLSRNDTLDQQSHTRGDLKGYNARAAYTEPLWKHSLLELSAGRSDSKSSSAKKTWDYNSGNGKYDQLNNMLSNEYENSYGYTTAGLRTRTQRKKYNYTIGLTWQLAELEGKIISGIKDSVIGKSFRNLLPNAGFRYYFSRFRSLALNYNTSTNQPGMSQLQPVPDNSNPLNIREGNPDLKQEYAHTLTGNLNLVSPYRNRNLFLRFMMQATQNKIVNYDSIDLATGIRTTRPVNVDGVRNLNVNFSYSMPVRFLKGTMELSSNTGNARNIQYIRGEENEIRTFSAGPEIRFDMNPTDKINVGMGAAVNYNRSRYSRQSAYNSKYISQEYTSSVDWELPKGFFFATDFTYTINSQRAAGYNTRIPLWNASLSKQVLKFNRGELKLSALDLLNRNQSVTRNISGNYIVDTRALTLRRYFMLTFTYSLSKMGLNNAGGGGGMRIISR